MHFWDYGNAFLLECARAGAKIFAAEAADDKTFKYPSYMQDIMGYFDLIYSKRIYILSSFIFINKFVIKQL